MNRSRGAARVEKVAPGTIEAMKAAVLGSLTSGNARTPRDLVHDVLAAMADVANQDVELARILRVLAIDIKEDRI